MDVFQVGCCGAEDIWINKVDEGKLLGHQCLNAVQRGLTELEVARFSLF